MASLPAVLLNIVLYRGPGAFRSLMRYGFHKEWLMEPTFISAWNLITEHIAEHGQVPSASYIDKRFSHFPFLPADQIENETPTAVAALLKSDYLQASQDNMIAQAMKLNSVDPMEALDYLQEQISNFRQMTTVSRSMSLAESVADIKERYEMAKKGMSKGIDFPWDTVNDETLGMHPEDFIVIYGMKKHMKTFVALYIATWAYFRCAARVLIITRELSIPMMMQRVAAFIAGIDYGGWRHGRLSKEDEEKAFGILDMLSTMERDSTLIRPANHHLGPSLRVADVVAGKYANSRDNVAALVEEFQPDIVLDDGLYLSDEADSDGTPMDWRVLTKLSQNSKRFAKAHKIVYLATTQASEKGKFAFSQAFGQDCDLSMHATLMPENLKRKLPNYIVLNFNEARECRLSALPIVADPCEDFSEMTLDQMIEFGVDKNIIGGIKAGEIDSIDYEDDEVIKKPKRPKKKWKK